MAEEPNIRRKIPDWQLLLLLGLFGLLGYLDAQLFKKVDTEELLSLFPPWTLWHLSAGAILGLAVILVDVIAYGVLGLFALIMFSGFLRMFLKRHFPEE